MGWERRRGMLRLQETCHYEWQNLIAEASRRGLLGEEELQWDSYEILSKQLEQEWIQSVQERKNRPRLKGNKRAPKSAEQRRKISEAIAAKWADPVSVFLCWGLDFSLGIAPSLHPHVFHFHPPPPFLWLGSQLRVWRLRIWTSSHFDSFPKNNFFTNLPFLPTRITVLGSNPLCPNIMEYPMELKEDQGESPLVMSRLEKEALRKKKLMNWIIW